MRFDKREKKRKKEKRNLLEIRFELCYKGLDEFKT